MDQKKIRVIVLGITIIIAIIIVVTAFPSKKKKEKEDTLEDKLTYAYMQENGTMVNNSKKLAEVKTYNGLEFTNIRFTRTTTVTSLSASVKNTTSVDMPKQLVDINILDEDGNIMTTFVGDINAVKAGETTTIDARIAANYVGAYDLEFVAPTDHSSKTQDTTNSNTLNTNTTNQNTVR